MSASPARKRVLLVKFGAIGDVLMAIPAASALHAAGYAVDWVCGPAVQPLLACFPWIHPIVADDRAILTGSLAARARAILALWRVLVPNSYDLAATLYYDTRYRLLTIPVRAARRLRLSQVDRATRILPGRHHSDEWMRILLEHPDGLEPQETQPLRPARLPPSPIAAPAPGRPRVALAPAGARNMLAEATLRRWPAELYVKLAGLLLAEGCEVVLLGGPDDTWVRPQFAALPITDAIGSCTLPETLAVLETAEVFVTHDTGPLHLAGVTSTGIVALFGPTDPHAFLPQRPGTVALWGGEGFACRPCYDGHSFANCPANDCMRQITPEMVLAEIRQMLQDRAHGVLAAPRFVSPASTMAAASLVRINSALLETRR